ncbi:hypothetical protein [Bradyrhizobium aeschynomenes]|uniref:hypothetical protein n=1 Tax=Bradyrhizobium aeschynomenes TaxID=2734909 RepID=UPI001FEEC8EF|nr:hypothetical protein [Bradyrhizobium aeschynomenes]
MALALLAGLAPRTQQALADQDPLIQRAVFAEEQLWLLDGGGRLSRLADSGERIDVATPDQVLELFVADGRIAIVTCPLTSCPPEMPYGRWTVRRRVGQDWTTIGEIASRGESLIATIAAEGTITLLTTHRIIDLGGRHTETALAQPSHDMFDPSKPLEQQQAATSFPFPLTYLYGTRSMSSTRLNSTRTKSWPVKAALMTSRHIFIGYNAGEFGGGLQRIDRATGVVSDIGDDEPIHGIVSIPWKPDCVAVAVGLIHMVASGRIVEVCDRSVRLLYEQHVPKEIVTDANGRIGEIPEHTTAFFGLMRTGDDLLAAGHDGLYQISRGDAVRQIPSPPFKDIGDVAVSFDIPNLVLVLTSANRRSSLSGSPPLLVQR